MERALNPELLASALGGEHVLLPTAAELAQRLADAEIRLLLHQDFTDTDLRDTAWYLHGIASSRGAEEAFGVARQRAAFRVAGHVFDLLLEDKSLVLEERLAYTFASQIAYLRSELNPNTIAIYRREFAGDLPRTEIEREPVLCALSFGVALLGYDARYIFDEFRRAREQVDDLVARWQVETIRSTPYGAAAGVAYGARDLLAFLLYGNETNLRRARETLGSALRATASEHDRTSRWVAAHLLQLGEDLERSSIWRALPPEVPADVKKAFSLGTPRVLTLWPPQVDTFHSPDEDGVHPLSPGSKRVFLSTPTSGGKTLTAQLLIATHIATEASGVCYIAPTRSLCHEVEHALSGRLKNLGARVVADLPEWGDIIRPVDPEPEGYVEVMTPERLSYLLRSGPSDVLNRFGLFVFDEIHNVTDGSRGWILETVVSYLHAETVAESHRIVLMSAAVGNRDHFARWMQTELTRPLIRHSEWRGPRRLHAIWTTKADWNEAIRAPSRSRTHPQKDHIPVRGVLRARVNYNGSTHMLTTTEHIGELVLRIDHRGERTKDNAASTPFNRMLLPLIEHLVRLGPVLVVESTRPKTVSLARSIAAQRDDTNRELNPDLLDLIETRLGREHPLYECISKGIAYHPWLLTK